MQAESEDLGEKIWKLDNYFKKQYYTTKKYA